MELLSTCRLFSSCLMKFVVHQQNNLPFLGLVQHDSVPRPKGFCCSSKVNLETRTFAVLDEATSALDRTNQEVMYSNLKRPGSTWCKSSLTHRERPHSATEPLHVAIDILGKTLNKILLPHWGTILIIFIYSIYITSSTYIILYRYIDCC